MELTFECRDCAYRAKTAKALREHVRECHNDKYHDYAGIIAYVYIPLKE